MSAVTDNQPDLLISICNFELQYNSLYCTAQDVTGNKIGIALRLTMLLIFILFR